MTGGTALLLVSAYFIVSLCAGLAIGRVIGWCSESDDRKEE